MEAVMGTAAVMGMEITDMTGDAMTATVATNMATMAIIAMATAMPVIETMDT